MSGERISGPPRRRGGPRLWAAILASATLALLAFPALARDDARPATKRQAPAGQAPSSGGLGAHEAAEGFRLVAAPGETVRGGSSCRPGAPLRSHRVAAIGVDITVNRYLDHDPRGRMYVLEEDVARVRAEEARNAAARAGRGDAAVSLGLQGDAIQPLTLRVLPGECLRVRLRNGLSGEAASLHLHGSSLVVAGTATPAIATNPRAIARPGRTVTYEWQVPSGEPEGTHYFHSHGDDRDQTSHGLFGAVIVEPKGSRWLDPITGQDLAAGWAAIIVDPRGSDFREVAIYYHEIGNETYQLLDKNDEFVPLVDPLLSDYRPGSRALNYRSEPFMNRMRLQQKTRGFFDESVSYSSYAFGDPATPIMRAYVGDPMKERVIHAGSEVFHVHHVHGGSIRWRRQPGVERAGFDRGLDKHPPLVPKASERVDSQSAGPSESFDLENECGSGGCQQSVGDYLFHCHVAQHYFAGMWGIWRVYNTLQDARVSTDSLPPLAELPDRAGRVAPAVPSSALVGKTVDWFGKRTAIAARDLGAWVRRQLPPAGAPAGYDASVLDWRLRGTLALGEPESRESWPGFTSRAAGRRLPIPFDPRSGKPAYPFLRPHLGKRPPFAPNHGPAPFLDPITAGPDPPAPGANGPGSVCPAGTKVKTFVVHAISLPVALNERRNLLDPNGEIFVLADEEKAVRARNEMRRPLAIRANAGEDCVDIVLASELPDSPEHHRFAKVNAHIHFAQFDVQASDGVITGFNYEQSVRPFTVEGVRLSRPAPVGARRVTLAAAPRFAPGAVVGVGLDPDASFESRTVESVSGNDVTFAEPLANAHGAGESLSTEFVRYRWYPDVQFGTAYFHDHVNAIVSWKHGLFGALISEPPGSTYRDPRTGATVRSGPIADVHTAGRVSADVAGSFRELVMFIQDDNPLTRTGRSTGGSFNLRAEPLAARDGPPDRLFSSRDHGDPATPVLEAHVGDPIVVRSLVAGTNEVHTWHLDGHWFRPEPWSATSAPTSTARVGISERFDLVIPRAGGPQAMAGDYLYYSGRSFNLREGSWGIVRVRDPRDRSGVRALPGRAEARVARGSICPSRAPVKRFDVAAVDVPLPMLGGEMGKAFVLRGEARSANPQPLVLHVSVGDCVRVRLTNETSGGPVSFHADMLAFDPRDSGGVAAGLDPPQAVAPGAARTYTFYAHPEVGETVALVRDFGDVRSNPGLGLYGAIVVGPRGARVTDALTRRDASRGSAWNAVVRPRRGPAYRDVTLLLQDSDAGIGTHRMPYAVHVSGAVGINYRAAPLEDRRAVDADASRVFSSAVHGDPPTPLLEAYAGEPVRIHLLAPWSQQAQVFTVEDHRWPMEPGRAGTTLLAAQAIGGLEALTLDLDGGAGGPSRLPGDYLYGDHREPYREAGMWGIFRVRARCDARGATVRPLTSCRSLPARTATSLAFAAAASIAGIALRRRRRAGAASP